MPLVPLGNADGRSRWLVEHEGRSFLVLADRDPWVVTDALCPHKQLPLLDGVERDGAIVCPGHWYTFDLTTGDCRTTGDVALTLYPVVEVDGARYADVPEPVAPLSWSERLRAHAHGASP